MITAAKASEAAKVLEVDLPSTSDAVSKAYRNKAKACHPDHHGNSKLAEWSRVSWAKEVLERWLKQNPTPAVTSSEDSTDIAVTGTCRACAGTGRVKVPTANSFRSLTMMCVLCNGTGTIEVKLRRCWG